MVEGHLAAIHEQERLNLIDTWNTLCYDEQRIQKIERWILSTFPGSSTNWLGQRGTHIDIAGDALSISSCFPLTSYSIALDRTHNGTCYFHFPVYLPYAKNPYFLDLPSQSLLHTSEVIQCKDRPTVAYIVDDKGNAFLINKSGTITPAQLSPIKNERPFTTMDLILGVDSRSFVNKPPRLDQYSILQLITRTSTSISDMHDVASVDPDFDFITNIGKALGTTITAIADGSSTVIKSIGVALHPSSRRRCN